MHQARAATQRYRGAAAHGRPALGNAFPSAPGVEEDAAAFERLKPRLVELWRSVFPRDDQHYTSVVVPSLSLDEADLRRVPGIGFLEERLLFLLIRLRNPHACLVYVTSQPVHPTVLDYYFELLAGVPASQARSRLKMLCAYDASPRPLTEKVLARPRLLARIRAAVRDPLRAYLTVYNSTPLERRLAVELGIPLNGVDPALAALGTKSGSRRVFREAGAACPRGVEDLRDPEEVADALCHLHGQKPSPRRCVLKLNDSLGGAGNAVITVPGGCTPAAARRAVQALRLPHARRGSADFIAQLRRQGAVLEEMLDGPSSSPSVQLRINPLGKTLVSSTHEQIVGGRTGLLFLGCRFPAVDEYRLRLQEAGLAIAGVLAKKGVVSRVSVDFLARREEGAFRLYALEVNLRMGGATHPMLALRFLTGGEVDPATGLFRSRTGQAKYYRASDNLQSDAYRRLLPEDLVDVLTLRRLHFSHGTETGVLFYMIGGISEFGRVGIVAIGNSPAEAEQRYADAVAVLDQEAAGP